MSTKAPRVLLVVTSDPRSSARPAEAVRIAAGVATWRKAVFDLYLHGPAVLALSEFADDLVDEDNFNRYLPVFRERGRPVYVESGSPHLNDLGEAPVPWETLDAAGVARLAAGATALMRF